MVLCADISVNKLAGLAGYFRLSTVFIGVTVISLATSIPEIVAHFTASVGILEGFYNYEISSAVVLGANIGSNVVQQTLILGIVVYIAGCLHFKRYFLWKSLVPMIATHAICLILGWAGTFSRMDGLLLFTLFIGYNAFLYNDERKYYREEDHGFNGDDDIPEGVPLNGKQVLIDSTISIFVILITIACSIVVLQITEKIVVLTGLGGSLIGVITLGVASALPELTTALSGIKNGDSGITLGTLVGSNVTNPLVAIGGGAMISTYWVPRGLLHWDLPWEIITGCLLWMILWFNEGKANKKIAVYLMVIYFVYVGFRMRYFGTD
jgi:cation:H+ antiporter